MKYFIIELLKFIKNNIVRILILSFIIMLFIYGIGFVQNYFNNDEEVQIETTDNLESLEEFEDMETVEESERIETITEQISNNQIPPAIFRLYIRHNIDHKAYTNNLLIEQYITLPEILEEVSRGTEINLREIIESNDNKVGILNDEGEEIKIMGVSHNQTSHLLTFYVNIGDIRNNLLIAEYYYNYILDGKVPFLEDTEIFVFNDPKRVELDMPVEPVEDEINISLPIVEEESLSAESNVSVPNVIKNFIVSLIISIGIVVFTSFFSTKLSVYLFYNIFDEDYFVLIDKNIENTEEITSILNGNDKTKKVILQDTNEVSEHAYFEQILEDSGENENHQVVTSFVNINEPESINRLIFIVREGNTSRNWYNKQRKFAKAYNIPTVVVQVNKS